MSSIDVIIPCYKYGHFLRQCVQSVLEQNDVTVRVLVIDDASPDNTAEVAQECVQADTRVTFRKHERNRGHIATYNEGIEWANSEYLLLLSADDYLLPGALGRAVALMDLHSEIRFAFGNAIRLEASGMQKPIISVAGATESQVVSGPRFLELSNARNIVPTPTAVVRTHAQKCIGGYRPELTHSGDMEMWFRLAAHGSVGMIKSYQAVYRRHAGNMSLAYMSDGFLPDMKQRKAAIDSFIASCGSLLPNPRALKDRFYRTLAEDAVSLSSAAFNAGNSDTSRALRDFACLTDPSVRWSKPWLKLACKRMMGRELWNIVQGKQLHGNAEDSINA